MATSLFLQDVAADPDPGTAVDLLAAIGTRGDTGVAVATRNTASAPVLPLAFTETAGGSNIVWFSPPLQAVTISGTVTFNFWMAESNMAANAGAVVSVEWYDEAGTTFLGTMVTNSAKGTELPVTTRAAQNWTASPTSRTLSDGDRIRIIVKIDDAGGSMATGHTVTLGYDGNTAAADGDSFVTFTETLTEFTGGGAEDKADTDSATLAENRTLTTTSAGSDTAALGESVTLTATTANSDSVSLGDASYILDSTARDSGALSDGTETVSAVATGSDTGTLGETPAIALAASETTTLGDTGTVSAAVTHSDTAAASETGSVTATASGSDSHTLADATYVLDSSASDAFTLAETVNGGAPAETISKNDTDSVTLGDPTVVLAAAGVGVDSGTLGDTGSASAALTHSDTATLGEDSSLDEGVTEQSKTASDTFSFAESATISVTLVGSDSASHGEAMSLDATASGSDSHTVADTSAFSVSLSTSDTLTFADVLNAFAATLPASDPFTLGESGSADVVDLGTFGDTGLAYATAGTSGGRGVPGASGGQADPDASVALGTPGASDAHATPGSAGSRIVLNDTGRSGA